MADEYFYLKFGIPRGPFSWPEFVELAKNRKITSKTRCIVNDNPSIAATDLFGKHWPQIDKIQRAANEAEQNLLVKNRANRLAEQQAKKEKSKREKHLKNSLHQKSSNVGMLGKLRSLFGVGKSGSASPENELINATLRVHVIDEDEQHPKSGWYKFRNSNWPNLYKWAGSYSSEWKQFENEVSVAGTSDMDYQKNFFMLASAPDFRITVQHEPDNPYDKNAIAVLGLASIDGKSFALRLGYLPKETAATIAELGFEIAAVPKCVWLPFDDCRFGLKVTVLQRSQNYLKRQNAK